MLNFQSSNPALNGDTFNEVYGRRSFQAAAERADTASVQGIVNKTAILIAIAAIAGAVGYWAVGQNASVLLISNIAALVLTLGLFFKISRTPMAAVYLAPVYGAVEGFFLGALTRGLESVLVAQNIALPAGLALQAFVVTIGVTVAMLALYSLRILRPTQMFTSVLKVATAGIMICYALSWVLWLFGVQLPFISLSSAFQGGWPAMIGLGLNVLILGVASLWLIVDFQKIEQLVASGAPRKLEWYGGFALLVTLAWIYYEAVKLVFRLALLFGSRD
jgi:uncharacterized YccA/Bax inhibitor family protein